MEFPFEPSLATVFFAYLEQNQLELYPLEHRPLCYRWFVEEMIILFKSSDHLQ